MNLPEEQEEDTAVVISTPIRTIRALKSKHNSQAELKIDSKNNENNFNMIPSNHSTIYFNSQSNNPFHSENITQRNNIEGVFQHKEQQKMENQIEKKEFKRKYVLSQITHLPSKQTDQQQQQNQIPLGTIRDSKSNSLCSSRVESSQAIMLPLNDKTNTLNERRRSFRRLTGKLSSTNNEFSQFEENSQKQRISFVNVNVDQAIQYILEKSKAIKDLIEKNELSVAFLSESLIDSRSFKIEYMMFLQKQIHLKFIHPELKNLSKISFEKLENFLLNRLRKQQKVKSLHLEYLKHTQSIQSLLRNQVQQLEMQLRDQNKISLDEECSSY